MDLAGTSGSPLPAAAHQRTAPRDTILYALSVGVGSDPPDADQLRLVYEKGLEALPTMAAVLAHPGRMDRQPRVRGQLSQAAARRAGPDGASAACRRRVRSRPITACRRWSTRGGQGRTRLLRKASDGSRDSASCCAPLPRRCSCVPTVVAAASAQPPRTPARGRAAARDEFADEIRTPIERRAAVPAQRRSEPDTRRSGRGAQGGLRAPDPARSVHVWCGRLSADAHSLRSRSRRASGRSAPDSVRRCIREKPSAIEGCRRWRAVQFQAQRAGAQAGRPEPGLRANPLS